MKILALKNWRLVSIGYSIEIAIKSIQPSKFMGMVRPYKRLIFFRRDRFRKRVKRRLFTKSSLKESMGTQLLKSTLLKCSKTSDEFMMQKTSILQKCLEQMARDSSTLKFLVEREALSSLRTPKIPQSWSKAFLLENMK